MSKNKHPKDNSKSDDLQKKISFDKEIVSLFKQFDEVMKINDLPASKRTAPIIQFYNNYKRLYNNKDSEPSNFYGDFVNLYEKNRIPALNILNNDNWLKKNTIKIQFGDGVNLTEKHRKYCIMLSNFYIKACEQEEEAEKRFTNPDNSNENENECFELIRRQVILLHLYRIFRLVIEKTDDHGKLDEIINDLEVNLGIKEGERVPCKENSKENSKDGKEQPPANPLNGMSDMITQVLDRMGIKSESDKKPSGEELGKVINSVFSDSNTQNALGEFVKNMQGCNDISQMFTIVSDGLKNPNLINTITSITAPLTEGMNKADSSGSGTQTNPKPLSLTNGKDEEVIEGTVE